MAQLESEMGKNLRGSWGQAFGSFFLAVLFILSIRWACFEPYVIPSGSMIPTLLVHDHILVNKFSYGLRAPFSEVWLLQTSKPQRGEVVVFKSVESADIFVVKRIIGLPGDEIRIDSEGVLSINGAAVSRREMTFEERTRLLETWAPESKSEISANSTFFVESLPKSPPDSPVDSLGDMSHPVIFDKESSRSEFGPFKVPPGSYFMMGDNRDHSADSRVWGALPFERILGRASLIWLSCEETLADMPQVCDPARMRWKRSFMGIQ